MFRSLYSSSKRVDFSLIEAGAFFLGILPFGESKRHAVLAGKYLEGGQDGSFPLVKGGVESSCAQRFFIFIMPSLFWRMLLEYRSFIEVRGKL